jgi:hypothetical protein
VEVINGEIVIRESSLGVGHQVRTIEEVDAEMDAEVVEEEGDRTKLTATYASYTHRDPVKRWDVEATKLFYKALQVYGMDFTSMSMDPLFFASDDNSPDGAPRRKGLVRTRRQLRNKYKNECRINPHLMDLIFRGEVQLAATGGLKLHLSKTKTAAKIDDGDDECIVVPPTTSSSSVPPVLVDGSASPSSSTSNANEGAQKDSDGPNTETENSASKQNDDAAATTAPTILDVLPPSPPPMVTQDEDALQQEEADSSPAANANNQDSEAAAVPLISLTGQQQRVQKKGARPRVRPRPRPNKAGGRAGKK